MFKETFLIEITITINKIQHLVIYNNFAFTVVSQISLEAIENVHKGTHCCVRQSQNELLLGLHDQH